MTATRSRSLALGWSMGPWAGGPTGDEADMVTRAEAAGYDSAWWPEAYGSDALTPLAWFGSRTTNLRLGTSIVQTAARTPTAVAMAAMTLDHLSNGRFVLGLGVSGPQVVEGWYGQPFDRPLARMREYVDVVRQVVRRQSELRHVGKLIEIPLVGGTGLGKPLRSMLRPRRPDLPILLAGQGPRSVALAAEVGDGWLPFLLAPDDATWQDHLARGFDARGGRPNDFEIAASVPVVVSEDVEAAAARIRAMLGFYVGGMGAPGTNFHHDAISRLGYASAAAEIATAYRDGNRTRAAAAVPMELVDRVALIGPPDRISRTLTTWIDSPVTTLVVQGGGATELELMASLVAREGATPRLGETPSGSAAPRGGTAGSSPRGADGAQAPR